MSEDKQRADGSDPNGPASVPDEVRDVVEEASDAELRALVRYVREALGPATDDTDTPDDGLDTPDGNSGTVDRVSADETSAAEATTTESMAAGRADSQTESTDEHSQAESTEERPEGVPSKATRVVKEINENRYYYWQWRDGDSVKSKYDRPADPE